MKHSGSFISAALCLAAHQASAQSTNGIADQIQYNSISASFYTEHFDNSIVDAKFKILALSGSTDLRFENVTVTFDTSLASAAVNSTFLPLMWNFQETRKYSSIRMTAGYDVTPWLAPYIGFAHYRTAEEVKFNNFGLGSYWDADSAIILGLDARLNKFSFALEVENFTEDQWKNPIYQLGIGYDITETTAIYATGTIYETDPVQVGSAQVGILRESDRYDAYSGFAYEHYSDWFYPEDEIYFGAGLTWKFKNKLRLIGSAQTLVYDSGEMFPNEPSVAVNLGIGYQLADNWTADVIAHDVFSDVAAIELAIKFETGNKRVRLMDSIRRFQTKANVTGF